MSALDSKGAKWRDWIIDNIDRGCTKESMLSKMLNTWEESQALMALGEAFYFLENPALNRPLINVTNNQIDLGDITAKVAFSLKSPHIVLVDNVFTDLECHNLIADAKQKGLIDSRVVDRETGDFVPHQARTSSGIFFRREENHFASLLSSRLAQLNQWPLDYAEGIQVLQYEPGQEYRPHLDWFDASIPGSAKQLKRGGQRVGTFVVYLTDVEAGGSTIFPNLGIEVYPRKGSAVYFSNINEAGQPCRDTLHGGSPVITGTKVVATYWQRERFY
ncbi:MAG: 2OG-Fe(II) oxygenase [Methylobacter sp.]|nr:2OG-Fe(II) oxygenase [Methylobacter sp.]MDP3054442.1 2OG-Fe(II) oxygenase [Methylobacter sp.]MDZ4220134.1 2OG-Fe(II) oxygenase [Methylobacter sp.]